MDQDEVEKVSKFQILRGPDLLRLLPLQTKLLENISSSESQASELSGPFSDVVYTVEVESKRKAKELYGKDLYTGFSFSPEFKAAMSQLKKENPESVKAGDSPLENVVEIKPEEDFNFEFLQFPGIDFEVESEEKEKEKETGKEKKKKKIWLDDEETLFDTMSGYWRLLSVFDKFKISPPWYDAYAEGKKHWLETDPVPVEVLENSRKKCLNWLSKYFDSECCNKTK